MHRVERDFGEEQRGVLSGEERMWWACQNIAIHRLAACNRVNNAPAWGEREAALPHMLHAHRQVWAADVGMQRFIAGTD